MTNVRDIDTFPFQVGDLIRVEDSQPVTFSVSSALPHYKAVEAHQKDNLLVLEFELSMNSDDVLPHTHRSWSNPSGTWYHAKLLLGDVMIERSAPVEYWDLWFEKVSK